MLKIIDLEMGNIGSVIKAIKHINAEYEIITEPSQLEGASKILLPGVGSLFLAAQKMHVSGFDDAIREFVIQKKTPILGICVGMQLLAKSGDEGGSSKCLGFIDAHVGKIDNMSGTLSIPHMGWNDVKFDPLPIFNNIESESCFYFVHSFAMNIDCHEELSVAYTDYGQNIVAYVSKGHVHGAQFHPEKSQDVGLKFLRNFIELC